MDYISIKINEFIEQYLSTDMESGNLILQEAKKELNEMDGDIDKAKFISTILERCTSLLEEHKPICPNPKNCGQEKEATIIFYQLNRELKKLGVIVSEDAFTASEKKSAEEKLDHILAGVDEVKMRQHAAYDVILEEIEELKRLFFLGKKNWSQLLLGKFTEMTISGIVSETISKEAVNTVQNGIHNLKRMLQQ